ncbi:condensation domain-containing protein [Fodinicola feengrottensis]|uniref:condensation domain-containing protein n=1 Tax=Fodinicola feengrottensis TaxID=435914 RepID=UPI0013D6F0FF|nr:condensation domain-containing protein [Fodinicola feengrottensis]
MVNAPAPADGPASLAQQGVWLSERRGQVRTQYHLPFTLTFEGVLDESALLAATRAVVAANPVLTSVLPERDGEPFVRASGELPFVEKVKLPAGGDLAEVLRERTIRPFELDRGPLLRMTLVAVDDKCHVLLVTAHHIVFDGESMEFFGRQLSRAYAAIVSGSGQSTFPPPYQYDEYFQDEQRHLTEMLPAAREFWREHWRRPDEVILPGLSAVPPETDPGDYYEFVLDGATRAHMREVGSALGVTLFELIQTALYGILYRYGNPEPVVGVAVGLRTRSTINSIGMFAEEVPLAAPGHLGGSFRALSTALHTRMRELQRFRRIPVNRAVRGGGVRPAIALSYRGHRRDLDFFPACG